MLVVILLPNMNAFLWNLKKGLTVWNFLEYSQVTSERVKFSCTFCSYGYCCCYVESSRPTVGNRCCNTLGCYQISRGEEVFILNHCYLILVEGVHSFFNWCITYFCGRGKVNFKAQWRWQFEAIDLCNSYLGCILGKEK